MPPTRQHHNRKTFMRLQLPPAMAGSVLLLACLARAAHAYPALPNLTNLDFNTTQNTPKGSFTTVNPAGWTGGTGLIFIDSTTPGQQAADSTYLQTYGNPVGSYVGNYVEADGNPTYEGSFNYSVTGLTKGQTYTLTFYQGASEQSGFGLIGGQPVPTTNRWIVSLGTSGMTVTTGGPNDPVYGATDIYSNKDATASVVASPLMTVPYKQTVGWQYVSVNLTADAPTDLLSFLAWGDNGSTANLPPIAFLTGVNSPPGLGAPIPEPASLPTLGAALMALGIIVLRRRQKRATSA